MSSVSSGWEGAIAALRAQGDAARASTERVDALRVDSPSSVRTTAVAVSYSAEADYLRSAQALLSAHLSGRRPPRRLPVARMSPCFRDVWRDRALSRFGGLWRAVPGPAAVKKMRSALPDPLLETVVAQAEALRASLHGYRQRDRLYESYIPDSRADRIEAAVAGGGRSAPTVPGFPDPGHPVNRAFPRGSGLRVQPGRMAEFNQINTDRFAVHKRALAFGDAVLALLVAHRLDGVVPQAGRLRGAARWVCREEALVPNRLRWPKKLNAFQVATLGGTGWLVLACAGLPLTFGQRAGLLSHPTWLILAAALIAGAGANIIYRHGPKLIQGPGFGAAVPGIAAGLVAVLVWQGQGPVADHFFAGPYERYQRQYTNGCLAASPYRHDAVRSDAHGGVLTVTPLSGGTILRLGPAEDHGRHPLRPLDTPTRVVLDQYGC